MYAAFLLNRIGIRRVATDMGVSGGQVYIFWICVGIAPIPEVHRGTGGLAVCIVRDTDHVGHKSRIASKFASEMVARRRPSLTWTDSIIPRSTIVVIVFVSFSFIVIFVSVSCFAISFVAVGLSIIFVVFRVSGITGITLRFIAASTGFSFIAATRGYDFHLRRWSVLTDYVAI